MANQSLTGLRKPWVDGLRALAQLMVICGHLQPGVPFIVITSAIKIPLFFAITGYVFRQRSEKEFYVNLCKRLILPWLALAMARYVGGAVFNGWAYLWEGAVSVITGKVVWFMPCIILAQIIHRYIRRFCPGPVWMTVASVVCFAAGRLLNRLGQPMMLDVALTAQLYLLIGWFFARWEERPLFQSRWLPGVGLGIYGLLCVGSLLLFPGRMMNIQHQNYYHLPLNLLMIFTGCLSLMLLAKQIGKAPRLLCFIGQNTLIFYIWEAYPRTILKKALSMVGLSLPEGIIGKLILLVVTLIGCSLAALIMNRFLPELVGKKRKKIQEVL